MKSPQKVIRDVSLVVLLVTVPVVHSEPTTPADPSRHYVRGGVPPKVIDLQAEIKAQAITYKRISFALGAEIAAGRAANAASVPGCDVKQISFDLRKSKVVTPIEDQGNCGSCWAFATAAAFESSLLLQSKITSDSPRSAQDDVSEQQILDCTSAGSSTENSCSGGWHDSALNYLKASGAAQLMSYGGGKYQQKKAASCSGILQPNFTVANWNYVGDGVIPSTDELKAAICAHGPIIVGVNSTGWEQYAEKLTDPNDPNKLIPNAQWPQMKGAYKGTPSPSKPLTWENISVGDIDHEVVIVGWDDTTAPHVWIVKNSWGDSWGESGYMRIAQGTANIGFNAAFVDAAPFVVGAPTKEFIEKIKNILQMKSTLITQEKQLLTK